METRRRSCDPSRGSFEEVQESDQVQGKKRAELPSLMTLFKMSLVTFCIYYVFSN